MDQLQETKKQIEALLWKLGRSFTDASSDIVGDVFDTRDEILAICGVGEEDDVG